MDRSVEWRYPNPFRVTPPFGGVGHWEGSGYHWEQSGSEYIQVTGDEWYQFIITVDEGYDELIKKTRINGNPSNPFDTNPNRFSEGDTFTYHSWMIGGDGMNYIITNVDVTEFEIEYDFFGNRLAEPYTVYSYFLDLERIVHHAVFYDYWNAYKYENLQWQLIESGIRRNHV